LVPKLSVIPLQSFSLRTRCGSPHGGPRPPEVAVSGLESNFEPRPKPWRVVADTPCEVDRLAFSTSPCMFLIGSRPGHDSSWETSRFARSKALGSARRPSPVVGLLSWGSSIRPFADTTVACVHSRLGRRPDFRTGLPRPVLVPFLPFLPASTVSSAEDGSEDPSFDCLRVCCTPQPAVGFAKFQVPRKAFRLSATRRSWTRRSDETIPCGEDPSKLSPPRQPSTSPSRHRSRPTSLARDLRSGCLHRLACPLVVRRAPASVLPRCASHRADLRALFHRGARCSHAAFPLRTARCSHGFWVDTFRCCRAFPRCPDQLGFRPRVNPRGVPTTRTSRGRQSVSALSGSGVEAGS